MTKKNVQPEEAKGKGASRHDVSGSWNSYALTQQEAGRIGELLMDYFEPDDQPALALLALLHSFTYTRDHTQRENMLVAVEAACTPALGVAISAVTSAVRKRFLELVKEGGAR